MTCRRALLALVLLASPALGHAAPLAADQTAVPSAGQTPAPPALASASALATLAGPDQPAAPLDPQSLAALNPVTLDLAYMTEHGLSRHSFTGVLLWDLLSARHAIGPARPRERVREVVVVTGADGYGAILSLAELDPAFEGKRVVLATSVDGAVLQGRRLRLAVPGDAHGGRDVRDVTRIEVRALFP